jgi:hypothetical protein
VTPTFKDFYAYDDGNAEYAELIKNLDNFAYQYYVSKPDKLTQG